MYIRPIHAELDIPILHEFIRENPLGLFTTSIPNSKYSKLQTTHIPFILCKDLNDENDKGILKGHIAKANPQSKSIIENLDSINSINSNSNELEEEVLILFNSLNNSYLTPKFYLETKPKNGKVVPTWNYSSVQIYGKAKIYYKDNHETSNFLQNQIEQLTLENENNFIQQNNNIKKEQKPWKVSDAPINYINLLKKSIIGIEIKIERIEGRFKLSQESNDGDWNGVIQGFKSLNTEQGDNMAQSIESRGKERASKKGVCPIS
ncbi:uncharacterized protein I206_107868 [Kwoniella pini CBS 10737]|uniref:Transcriptional regulator n=1 Tax=Kwoniella pini CBS 10737 TaxID=1296096 RepID=A0A1B9HYK9_9TREE|nr:uncharacterized protein I206_06199 [Kwoniella pini CBS 10737]OCF48331.1 hypothetical protein I206_06199 [Kwoniella pini CBS 10737]